MSYKISLLIRQLSVSAISLVTLSCQTIIDADLPLHEVAITINGTFHPDSTVSVHLTENKFILDKDYDFQTISDATVQLYSGAEMIGQLSEDDSISGMYMINFYPEAGVEYRITAAKEGFETVEASDIIPETKANASIKAMEEKADEYGSRIYELTYTIEDPIGEDYYEVRLYKRQDIYESYRDEDTSYYYTIGKTWREIGYNEVGAELNEFEGYNPNYYFSDELFDGRKKESRIEFYNYGYYGGNSIYYENGSKVDTLQLILRISKVSESYFKYKTTRELHRDVGGNIFAEPAPVYNNVKNGFGIFAGYNANPLRYDFIVSGEN